MRIRFQAIFHHTVLILSAFLMGTQAWASCEAILSAPTPAELAAWTQASLLKYGNKYSFEDGQEELEALKRANRELESRSFTEEELRSRGWIVDGEQDLKLEVRAGADKSQNMPFTELKLPLAHSGMYLPKVALDRQIHTSLSIFIPGIGTVFSNAKSVTSIAQSFTSLKYRAELGDLREEKGNPIINFRSYSVALDMPFNGMAMNAPGALGTAEGTIEVVRHAMLILRILNPGLPLFVSGRSQGGIVAMILGQTFGPEDGLNGAIAINPSPPDIENLEASIRIHEDSIESVIDDANLEFVDRAWLAYHVTTPNYLLTERSRAPTLILHGDGDPSYDARTYLPNFLEPYVQSDSSHRQLLILKPGSDFREGRERWLKRYAHDLWRRDNPVRESVLGAMKDFMIENSDRASIRDAR